MPNVHCNLSSNSAIDDKLARFWEIEEIPNKQLLSKDEIDCEAHFSSNTKRDDAGRFIVTLPLKDSVLKLGDSYSPARRRFLSLEKKLANNKDLKRQYCDFIEEYKQLGHMKKVIELDASKIAYYLPHHGVSNENSSKTFFRYCYVLENTAVIAADIEKMYRMTQVTPEQRSLQRILWRDSPLKLLEIYELQTVTYGTASTSYLSIRCLHQLGLECATKNPRASAAIINDFYVDDLLSGAETEEEAIELANAVSNELKGGCFNENGFQIARKLYTTSRLATLQTKLSLVPMKALRPSDLFGMV